MEEEVSRCTSDTFDCLVSITSPKVYVECRFTELFPETPHRIVGLLIKTTIECHTVSKEMQICFE